ncbi:MAG: DUF3108 domain-containing protein [Epsilonproteobacteria bacterium]|nr:DUF3108 domain-containing protein [Campylobacterota bacterium]
MRLFFLLISLLGVLWSKEIDAFYKVSYGIIGKVAKAYATFRSDDKNYSVDVKVESIGLAKLLSHNRKEYYHSEGFIRNGFLYPTKFERIKETSKRKDKKVYFFDHKNRKILLKSEKHKYGKFHSQNQKYLNYFTPHDLLSLYLNIPKLLRKNKTKYTFYAVGGSEDNGKIDLFIPQGKELKKLQKLLKSDGLYLGVVLHQKIFSSKKGELFLVMDRDGVTKKGLLKDVILFGDIVGTLKQKRVKN